MINLKRCACGETPTKLFIYDTWQGGKWGSAAGNCGCIWRIEFRTDYNKFDSLECMLLAIEAWNDAYRPRIKSL
jgi:hypothetical protein